MKCDKHRVLDRGHPDSRAWIVALLATCAALWLAGAGHAQDDIGPPAPAADPALAREDSDLRLRTVPADSTSRQDQSSPSPIHLPALLNHQRQGIQPIAQLGGLVSAVAWQGDLLYAAVGPRLLAYDASDLRAFDLLGQSEPQPGWITDIAIADGYAYATDWLDRDDPNSDDPGGLRVYDIRQPARPRQVAHLPLIGIAWRVVVQDKRAYVASMAGGLQIVDISRPDRPRLLGQPYRPGEALATSLQVLGERVYVIFGTHTYDRVYGTAGLLTMDVSDPAHPRESGFAPADIAGPSALIDRRLYAASPNGPILAFDLRDAGGQALRQPAWDLDLPPLPGLDRNERPNHGIPALSAYDLSDAAEPRLRGRLEGDQLEGEIVDAGRLFDRAGHLLLTSDYAGLRAFDLRQAIPSPIGQPVSLFLQVGLGQIDVIAATSTHAVLGTSNGLWVYSVQDLLR